MHKNLIVLSLAILIFQSCSRKEEEVRTRPNIIFIMSDDHAQRAISAYGDSLIHTPNIDRLAQEGVLFNNSFVANSICAPSRATMLTGKFSHMNGKKDNLDTFDGTQMTFPKLLQQAGYQTAVMGKWHLKSEPQGFDDWKVLIGQGDYYQPQFVSGEDTFRVKGYVTDIITDYSIDYLRNRDQEKPFCLLYHHKAPHRNWMPKLTDFDYLADQEVPMPETLFDAYENRQAAEAAEMRIADMYFSMDMKLDPEHYGTESARGGNSEFDPEREWQRAYNLMMPDQKEIWDAYYDSLNEAFKRANLTGDELTKWKYQRYMKDYLRCIKAVDDNVGRLLEFLDRNGLAENTLVVYTSDQGFYLGEHGWFDKRFMYEESFRTPLLMRYPAVIPSGTKANQMVQNIDYAPTFLDMAGVEVPDEIQGRSLVPVLVNPAEAEGRPALYYHYYEYPDGWHKVKRHYGVRTDRYKLIHFYHDIDSWELYDLESDPQELNNLYGDRDYQNVQEELHEKLEELRVKYNDQANV